MNANFKMAGILVLAASFLILPSTSSGPEGLWQGDQALAGSRKHVRRSGVVRGHSRVGRKAYAPARYGNRVRGVRSTRRSGAYYAGRRGVANRVVRSHRSTGQYGLNQRRRQIARYNDQVIVRNELRRRHAATRAIRNDPNYFNRRQNNYDYDDYGIVEGATRGVAGSPCPNGYNCGYRLYENGSGPRIITPQTGRAGLPAQDGLQRARVITLD